MVINAFTTSTPMTRPLSLVARSRLTNISQPEREGRHRRTLASRAMPLYASRMLQRGFEQSKARKLGEEGGEDGGASAFSLFLFLLRVSRHLAICKRLRDPLDKSVYSNGTIVPRRTHTHTHSPPSQSPVAAGMKIHTAFPSSQYV